MVRLGGLRTGLCATSHDPFCALSMRRPQCAAMASAISHLLKLAGPPMLKVWPCTASGRAALDTSQQTMHAMSLAATGLRNSSVKKLHCWPERSLRSCKARLEACCGHRHQQTAATRAKTQGQTIPVCSAYARAFRVTLRLHPDAGSCGAVQVASAHSSSGFKMRMHTEISSCQAQQHHTGCTAIRKPARRRRRALGSAPCPAQRAAARRRWQPHGIHRSAMIAG